MDLKLRGRLALVTGSSKGIGAAVAESFASEGCDVVLTARSEDLLADKSAALREHYGVNVTPVAADLSQEADRMRLLATCPLPDILVNNAGEIPSGTIEEVDDARWRAAWDLKVFGYINLSRAMYRHMRGHPPKVIVNVIGTGAERPQWRYVCGNAANIAIQRDVPPLTASTTVASKNWNFSAATYAGKPIRSHVVVAFVFRPSSARIP